MAWWIQKIIRNVFISSLIQLGADIGQCRACLQRAEDCAQKAAAESDPKIKADFLDTKRRWTALARNYEFANQLNDDRPPKSVAEGANAILRKLMPTRRFPPPWSVAFRAALDWPSLSSSLAPLARIGRNGTVVDN